MTTRAAFAPLLFVLQTAACQIIGISIVIGAWALTGSLPAAIAVGSGAAFACSNFLALSLPWQILNLILIPASGALLVAPLPSWVPLTLVAITVVIYAPAFWTRVPYYPTSRAAYAILLTELPTDRPFSFVDIGCGFGDLLLFLSKHRPLGRYTGVEIGLLPFLVAWCRACVLGQGRIKVRYESMWRLRLGEFDFVYAFLSPAPMSALWKKAKEEMRRGTTFITNSFAVPEKASRESPVMDEKRSILYVHDM